MKIIPSSTSFTEVDIVNAYRNGFHSGVAALGLIQNGAVNVQTIDERVRLLKTAGDTYRFDNDLRCIVDMAVPTINETIQ